MASAITLQSTTAEGQLAELMAHIQNLEASDTANPNGENRVTGTYNTDTLAFNGTVNLPVTLALNAQGKPEFTAAEYLSDA